jgi:hypothetical protein
MIFPHRRGPSAIGTGSSAAGLSKEEGIMKTVNRLMQTAMLAACVTGCSVGNDFVKPDGKMLTLGQTTYHEILQRFGSPRQEGSVSKNDRIMKTATYAYASTLGKSVRDGATAGRAMGFYFLDNSLVGYDFLSTFPEDHTDFDESKVEQIKKGETTRVNLLELLGQPGGIYRYPMIKSKEDEALVWKYLHIRGSMFSVKPYLKSIVVTLDADNKVKEIEFAASGEK